MNNRIKLQPRTDSKVMIAGIVTLVAFFFKSVYNYEIPNEILDQIIELAMTIFSMYAIGNSPRIKGEY